jgi:hypothetical protein
MSATKTAKKSAPAPTTKSARAREDAAAQSEDAVAARTAENRERFTSEPSPTEARASAITDPNAEITSSEDAAAARKAAPHAPGATTAEQVDEAKPVAFPENPHPINPSAVENELVKESRLRARLVGESAAAAANPSAKPAGTVELRSVQRLGYGSAGLLVRRSGQDTPEIPEDDEVVVTGMDGISEIVFRRRQGGIEIVRQDANAINALRGGGVTTLAYVSEEAWDQVVGALPGTQQGEAPEAQSAAEQRSGAGEGEDAGPVAPRPVEL